MNQSLGFLLVLLSVSACNPDSQLNSQADVTLNGVPAKLFGGPNEFRLGQEIRVQASFKLPEKTVFNTPINTPLVTREEVLRDYDIYGILFGPGKQPYRSIPPEAAGDPALTPLPDSIDSVSPAIGANRVVSPVRATVLDGQTLQVTFTLKGSRVNSTDTTLSYVSVWVAFMIMPKGTAVSEFSKAAWVTPTETNLFLRILP
jgi:hypothetical protein